MKEMVVWEVNGLSFRKGLELLQDVACDFAVPGDDTPAVWVSLRTLTVFGVHTTVPFVAARPDRAEAVREYLEAKGLDITVCD